MPTDPLQQVGLRLPASLVQRIDAYAKTLNDQHPGMDASRTDAARILLTSALDAAGIGKAKPTTAKRAK